MISKERIEKYFHDQCSAEEREEITAWLEANPEELDKYLSEGEWEAFSAPTSSENTPVPKPFVLRVLSNVWIRAACCLAFLIGGWLLLPRRQQLAKPQLFSVANRQPPADSLEHIANTSLAKMLFRLPDGSEIELFPESELAYAFRRDRRTVYLTGKASFTVAKDPFRPFTVCSGQLSTAVLGTSFTISDLKYESTIRIRLRSGKIRVSRILADSGASAKGLYLLPQDLLVYNKQNGSVNIIRKGAIPSTANNRGHSSSLPNWYMFKEQSLDLVFDQLSVYYGVEIDYYPADIRECFFTGKYENGDSLDTILHDIGLLNRLSIIKSANGYTVRKLVAH